VSQFASISCLNANYDGVDNARPNFLICRSENSPVIGSAGLLAGLHAAKHRAGVRYVRENSRRFAGRKFAVRISCSGEPEDPNNIDPGLITAVELVSLPSKEVVTKLPESYDSGAPNVIWSPDSRWLAFSLSDGPRVTDTHVYHRSGDNFGEFKTDNLQIDVKGDVRNEYVTPIRWVTPGVSRSKA
jgi:hypothetical protein